MFCLDKMQHHSRWLIVFLALLMFCRFSHASAEHVKPSSVSKTETVATASIAKNSLPAAIPVQRDKSETDETSSSSILRYLIGIFVFVIFAGFFYFRTGKVGIREQWEKMRTKSISDGSVLRQKKQLVLTSKHSLHLVTWGGEDILIACTDQGITVIPRTKALLSKEEIHAYQINEASSRNQE